MGKCECDDEDGNGNAERERERVEMHTTELFLWQQRGEVASLRMRRAAAAAAAEFNFYKRVDVMQREVSPTDRETALNSGAALYPLGYKNIKKEKRKEKQTSSPRRRRRHRHRISPVSIILTQLPTPQ